MSSQVDWRHLAGALGGTARDKAKEHRPTDPVQLREEVQRLADQGWHARDISVATGLSHLVVEQIVRERRAAA